MGALLAAPVLQNPAKNPVRRQALLGTTLVMLSHHSHVFVSIQALQDFLRTGPLAAHAAAARSVLVQVYSMHNEMAAVMEIVRVVSDELPQAVIVGASTVGEIAGGRLLTHQTVLGFTCMSSSTVTVIDMPCGGDGDGDDEASVGAALGHRIAGAGDDVRGALLLATPLSLDAAALLRGIESVAAGVLLFGGGAGDYAMMANSLVFTNSAAYACGVVAVVFAGADLQIDAHTYLGWRPLSKSMAMTAVRGLTLAQVDGEPAFEMYRRYLNIPNDSDFFLNALEFPLLIEREGRLLARVPVAAHEDGSIQFVADLHEGDQFRLGYGDPVLIVEGARSIHAAMAQERPQAIFLFSCGCRRFLMQGEAELETVPFESIAPTFGFYTYGEFFGTTRLSLLNATMVAVSLREGPQDPSSGLASEDAASPLPRADVRDPYANQHSRVVSRLVQFIEAVTSELEASNQEITQLSITDRLTGIANRTRLDQVLEDNLLRARRYATSFSVMLLDIDHFKRVNDLHGHLVGDRVLAHLARVLTAHTRSVDTVGRWGGEEFMLVLPNTPASDCLLVAEKLRGAIAATDFLAVGPCTCSFGIASYAIDDDADTLTARADQALYAAKHAGRNTVRVK